MVNEVIRYSVFPSELGHIGMAMCGDRVCFLGFTEGREQFAAVVRAEFPTAEIESDEAGLAAAADAVRGVLRDRPTSLEIADVGTPFQRRVWNLLQQIPTGQTRTYQQLAAELGNPNAVRAVARACATNPISLLIPCHRVIRSDGSLAGYRWGLDRKQALLDLESARSSRG